MDYIDISVTLRNGMPHYPGDEPVRIERMTELGEGDEANLSRIVMSLHSGTHMDAPVHFVEGEAGIHEMPLNAPLGRARVVETGDAREITPAVLQRHAIGAGDRILFKTRNSREAWKSDDFVEDYVYLSRNGAEYLAEKGISLVGIDYLSIGSMEEAADTHAILLRAGIWIVEGLDLSLASGGDYELLCLPLKVANGDGAPARAILRPLPS